MALPAGTVAVCEGLGVEEADCVGVIGAPCQRTSVIHASWLAPSVAPQKPSHAVPSPVDGAALRALMRSSATENDADSAPRASLQATTPDVAFVGMKDTETDQTSQAPTYVYGPKVPAFEMLKMGLNDDEMSLMATKPVAEAAADVEISPSVTSSTTTRESAVKQP